MQIFVALTQEAQFDKPALEVQVKASEKQVVAAALQVCLLLKSLIPRQKLPTVIAQDEDEDELPLEEPPLDEPLLDEPPEEPLPLPAEEVLDALVTEVFEGEETAELLE